MKTLARLIAIASLLAADAYSQNWATVSAANITDLNQNKLAAGQLCFLGTDQNDNPVSFSVGGGGQVLKRAFCSNVTGGAVAAFTVPNPASTSPSGIYYRVTVKDTSTGLEVLRYTQVTFSGGAFSFDNYAPVNLGSFAPLSGTSVSGNLSVSGNASVTGSITGSSLTHTILNGASNGNSVTLLNEQGPTGALTGNSADQTVYTYTLPANTLGAGKCLLVQTWFNHTSGSGSVAWKLFWGGSVYLNSSSTLAGTFIYETTICNNSGVTNAQHGSVLHNVNNTVSVGQNGMTGVFSPLSASVDATQAQIISLTFNVANTDQAKGGQFMVELIQ